jgi:environmental stress-induced protein Ves
VARWFCVLQGEGVRLTLGEGQGEQTLTPDSPPLHFDGAAAPGCTLLGGPTLDLNFMARQDAGRAEMTRAVPGVAWSSPARLRAVYARDALTLRAGDAPARALPAGTLAFDDAAHGEAWQVAGVGALAWWLSFESHAR